MCLLWTLTIRPSETPPISKLSGLTHICESSIIPITLYPAECRPSWVGYYIVWKNSILCGCIQHILILDFHIVCLSVTLMIVYFRLLYKIFSDIWGSLYSLQNNIKIDWLNIKLLLMVQSNEIIRMREVRAWVVPLRIHAKWRLLRVRIIGL